MIKWFKRNDEQPDSKLVIDSPAPVFERFKSGLVQTRQQLGEGISRLLLGKKEIDADLMEQLETLLLVADVGMEVTQTILQTLQDKLTRKQLLDGDAVLAALKDILVSILTINTPPIELNKPLHVILMVGVNGAGKTTTIGKLAKQYQKAGKRVMFAAADTFRAAAVEQLQAWGERNQVSVIAQHTGADSASVSFDALQAAKARGMDVLIIDTAGRLHTQHNLMDELKKIKRVLQKLDADTPHETMLVLDASIGQNALNQAREFQKAVGLTGITMTKLDGTAKGGILFAIAHELTIPFRYVGVGEGVDDLQLFNPINFVNSLFNNDNI